MADKNKRTKEKIKTRKNISKYIKQMRKLEELRQEDLADEIFVTRKAISKWETNISSPSVDSVNELSRAYNVSFEEIVNGKKVPEEKMSKVIHVIIKNPWIKVFLFFIIYFLILIISNLYDISKFYYFDYKTNNYTINKGKIYTLRNNINVDIPSFNYNNVNLIFKMHIINKRITIYKCHYINGSCHVYYVREGVSNRMIKRNDIYLYIEKDNEYVLNKLKLYRPSFKKRNNQRLDYCVFKECNYYYGLSVSS